MHALPNYVASATAFSPNDPGRGAPGMGAAPVELRRARSASTRPSAWQNAINAGAPGGEGVVVAVLDTGVAYRTSRPTAAI